MPDVDGIQITFEDVDVGAGLAVFVEPPLFVGAVAINDLTGGQTLTRTVQAPAGVEVGDILIAHAALWGFGPFSGPSNADFPDGVDQFASLIWTPERASGEYWAGWKVADVDDVLQARDYSFYVESGSSNAGTSYNISIVNLGPTDRPSGAVTESWGANSGVQAVAAPPSGMWTLALAAGWRDNSTQSLGGMSWSPPADELHRNADWSFDWRHGGTFLAVIEGRAAAETTWSGGMLRQMMSVGMG